MTALAWVALFLAVGPLVLGLWNLWLYRVPAPATGTPALSVLIPARNEEANIGEACAAVLASVGVDLELIVLDDASTDRTPAILQAIADPRLRVATAPRLPPGWSGKQHACHVLGGLARHELMVFVDADVRLQPDALARMAGYMQRHPVGLASGFPAQVTVTWSEQLLLPLIHFLLLGYLPMAAMLRSASPGLGAGCGQLFIARREAYVQAGGHTAIKASLHDGLMLPRAFRQAGLMTGLFDASPFARCRMYANAGQVWEGLCKNATEGMAKPRALPVWTVILFGGQVLPALLVLAAVLRLGAPGGVAALALAASMGLRLILAARFRQPWGAAGHLARAGLYGAVALLGAGLAPEMAAAATLDVVVANLRNDNGHVRVAVCTQAMFLTPHCDYNGLVKAKAGEVVVTLQVPPGTWAVQAFQDEHDHGQVDRNLLGIPTVGLGFSNDAPIHFGPPSYADAAFQLGAAGGRIRLSLRYF